MESTILCYDEESKLVPGIKNHKGRTLGTAYAQEHCQGAWEQVHYCQIAQYKVEQKDRRDNSGAEYHKHEKR